MVIVGAMKSYVRKIDLYCFNLQVAKQWFDFDRNTFAFIKKVKSAAQVFTYTSDFDENGILYWIGTNARYVSTFNKNVTVLYNM